MRVDLTTSSRSSAVGATLALPCLASPWRCVASAGSLPSLEGAESRFPGIYNIVVTAVAFVFFPQVGLRTALRRSKAAADRPTTPQVGQWAATPYLLSSWSRSSGRRWDLLVQSIDISTRSCPSNAAPCCQGTATQRRAGPATRPVTLDVTSHVVRS
jgi:hypothetical protein